MAAPLRRGSGPETAARLGCFPHAGGAAGFHLPVAFFGHSMGANTAYEVVGRLHAAEKGGGRTRAPQHLFVSERRVGGGLGAREVGDAEADDVLPDRQPY